MSMQKIRTEEPIQEILPDYLKGHNNVLDEIKSFMGPDDHKTLGLAVTGMSCEMATNAGISCNVQMISGNDPCKAYCFQHWKRWILDVCKAFLNTHSDRGEPRLIAIWKFKHVFFLKRWLILDVARIERLGWKNHPVVNDTVVGYVTLEQIKDFKDALDFYIGSGWLEYVTFVFDVEWYEDTGYPVEFEFLDKPVFGQTPDWMKHSVEEPHLSFRVFDKESLSMRPDKRSLVDLDNSDNSDDGEN